MPRGRVKGSRNNRTEARAAAVAKAAARIAEAYPGGFEGDAHALLVAIYQDPEQELRERRDAAKAAIAYERPRPVAPTLANAGAAPVKVRSELDLGRRLAYVLEMVARGEIKATLPADMTAPG
jgi:hypothetical protein